MGPGFVLVEALPSRRGVYSSALLWLDSRWSAARVGGAGYSGLRAPGADRLGVDLLVIDLLLISRLFLMDHLSARWHLSDRLGNLF